MKYDRFDIHQHITDQIVSAIERGAGDWLPWHRAAGSILRPANIASHRGPSVSKRRFKSSRLSSP